MTTRCRAGGTPLASDETIHVAGEGPRCYPCFNRETAERLGLDYDEPRFQPIVLEDADGAPHTFAIRSMLVPTGHEMEALERVGEGRAGYRFAVLGDFDADAWDLFRQLHANMRRAMTIRSSQPVPMSTTRCEAEPSRNRSVRREASRVAVRADHGSDFVPRVSSGQTFNPTS